MFKCKGCTEVARLVGEVEVLRKMVESLKRMVTGQGLEETSGETGDREATLKEAEEREKCVGEKTAERSYSNILCRITAQSNAEARGKIACCPSDRPDNMVQQLAGVNQHHVRCRCAIYRHSNTLDERCFISFSQTPELVDDRRKYMTQFVLEDICHLHATLLTDDPPGGRIGSQCQIWPYRSQQQPSSSPT